MCHRCNQPVELPCGCDNTPCVEETPCDCPVVDLSTKCLVYSGETLTCSQIESGINFDEFLLQLDAFICTSIEQLQASINLINIGTGAEIYKGIDTLGKRQIRKLNETGTLLVITQNTDDITFSIDETALIAFIKANQYTYSAVTLGTASAVYKNNTVVGNNTQFNFRSIDVDSVGVGTEILDGVAVDANEINVTIKSLASETLTITEDSGTISIELPADSTSQNFIVNSNYTGTTELGTLQKPFKNLQNALNAYKGTGTNAAPQFEGAIIRVQKDVNVFTGVLAYKELDLILEAGVTLVSNPTTGNYLLDIDSDATLPGGFVAFSNIFTTDIKITLEEGASIQLSKQGFKNRGTNLNTNSSLGKIVRLLGSGIITIASDASIVSPSVRTVISANADNQAGFFNDGNVANFITECNITTPNTQIYKVGLNAKLFSNNNTLQFGNTVDAFNPLTRPFEINGGSVTANTVDYTNYNQGVLVLDVVHSFSGNGVFSAKNSVLNGDCNYIFENIGSTKSNLLLNTCTSIESVFSGFAKSTSVIWDTIRPLNCYIENGMIDPTQVVLVPPSINIIDGQLVETLNVYTSRADAVANGLFAGCKFKNQTTYAATAIQQGREYQILTVGTTDYTLIGSANNTVGTKFKANSTTPLGTGTVLNFEVDIVI